MAADRISAPSPQSLDFAPHSFPLARDLVPAGVAAVSMAPGRTRLLTFGDRLLLLDAGMAIIEIEDGLGRRHEIAIQDIAPGYRGDAVVVSNGGSVFRWSPGQELKPAFRFDSSPVVLAGVPEDRLLIQTDPSGDPRVTLFDTHAGRTVWAQHAGRGSAVVPWHDSVFLESSERAVVMRLDLETGRLRWRSAPVPGGIGDPIGIVSERLWVSTHAGSVCALDLDSGKLAIERKLRSNRNPQGILDELARFHACHGLNYQILDLAHGGETVMFAAFRITAQGPSTALGRLAVLARDGRLIFADDRGKVFVVPPEQPSEPRILHTAGTAILQVGISCERLVTLDTFGTLRFFGPAEAGRS